MSRLTAWRAWLPVFLIGGLAGGCSNPFAPAKPEQPTGAGIVARYNTPENVLETITAAYRARGVSGQVAFYDAIADSTSTSPGTFAFYSFHAPAVVDAWHADTGIDPPPVWDRTAEKTFFDWMSGQFQGLTYSLIWSNDNLSPLPPTQPEGIELLRRHYELIATTPDESIVQLVAVGYADLYFQKLGSRYALFRWEDRLDPEYGVRPPDPEHVSMSARRLQSITP